MARQKIGEYKAKKILFEKLGLPYHGIFYDSPTDDFSKLEGFDKTKTYVVKVDEGIKKRFKKGLVKLDVKFEVLHEVIQELEAKGHKRLLIEEFKEHVSEDALYLALERRREGVIAFVSKSGGVDIEDNQDKVKQFVLASHYKSTSYSIASHNISEVTEFLQLPEKLLQKILHCFDECHFSFLEINPLVITEKEVFFLDLAVEVDSAGEFFVQTAWSSSDFIGEAGGKTEEEQAVDMLSSKSQASFKLNVLNPDGSIFMLLSGGGASIVLADEVYNQGQGRELANYGEYSGNPNAEETYLYTKQILSLLLKSKSEKKVLIIAGGVANFTDIRITFKGIIQALDEVKEKLQQEGIKVFVRRGGPYQDDGLQMMEKYLRKENLLGLVSGPEMVLTNIVTEALASLQ